MENENLSRIIYWSCFYQARTKGKTSNKPIWVGWVDKAGGQGGRSRGGGMVARGGWWKTRRRNRLKKGNGAGSNYRFLV